MGTTNLYKSVRCIGYDSNYKYRADVTVNSQNIATNSSSVTIKFYMNSYGSSAGFSGWVCHYCILVDGAIKRNNTKSSTTAVNSGSTYKYIGEWTGNITHGDDGNKSIAVGLAFRNGDDFWNTNSYLPRQNSGNDSYASNTPNYWAMGNVSLPQIARASTLGINDFNMGENATINITKAATGIDFYNTLTYSFPGLSTGTIQEKTVANSVSWDTASLKDAMINSVTSSPPTAICRITTQTFIKDSSDNYVSVGSNYKDVTLTVPNDAATKPTLTGLSKEGVNTKDGCYVQGKSSVKVTANGATAKLGASISNYNFTVGETSYTELGVNHTDNILLSKSGTVHLTASVADSRKYISDPPISESIYVYPYAKPYVTSVSANRYEDVLYTYQLTGSESGIFEFTINEESHQFAMPTPAPTALVYSFAEDKLHRDSAVGTEIPFLEENAETVFDISSSFIESFINEKDDGTCLKISAVGGVSSIGDDEKNTLDCTATCEDITKTIPSESPIINNYCIFRSTADAQREVIVTITDAYGETTPSTLTVPTAFVTMDFKASGTGAAFGKTAETDNLLDVKWDMKVRGDNGLTLSTPLSVANGGTGADNKISALTNLCAISYGQRVQIPSSADLNNYFTPGCFGCSGSSTAQAITNCPSSQAFILNVFEANGSGENTYIVQQLTNILGNVWYRYRYVNENTTGNWMRVLTDGDYPLGSIYITSEIGATTTEANEVLSTTLASRFGGTWTLIDKEFSPFYTGVPGNFFSRNSTNISSVSSGFMSRSGHSITIRLGFTLGKNMADTTLTLGTLNIGYLGVSTLLSTYVCGWSDGGNCMAMLEIGSTCYSVDVIPDSYISSGETVQMTTTITIPQSHMLDTACNKFYWKRTN